MRIKTNDELNIQLILHKYVFFTSGVFEIWEDGIHYIHIYPNVMHDSFGQSFDNFVKSVVRTIDHELWHYIFYLEGIHDEEKEHKIIKKIQTIFPEPEFNIVNLENIYKKSEKIEEESNIAYV